MYRVFKRGLWAEKVVNGKPVRCFYPAKSRTIMSKTLFYGRINGTVVSPGGSKPGHKRKANKVVVKKNNTNTPLVVKTKPSTKTVTITIQIE